MQCLHFFSLLEEVLGRFERENGGHLLVATLCLLEASSGGLQEAELLDILADEEELVPPSPYEEKGIALQVNLMDSIANEWNSYSIFSINFR